MDEELLIHYVKKYPELNDPTHRLYKDLNRRSLIWRKIANKMKLQAHECRDRWKKIRENYRKAMKLRQMQKSKGIKKLKPIKHGQIMAFLDDTVDSKETECERGDTQSAGHSRKPERYVEQPLDPLTSVEKNYEAPKTDTVITFFTNLGETVNTFPEEVRVRVKRDIFKIINDAEEEVVMNKLQIRHVRSEKMDYGMDY